MPECRDCHPGQKTHETSLAFSSFDLSIQLKVWSVSDFPISESQVQDSAVVENKASDLVGLIVNLPTGFSNLYYDQQL
jgi:hypothetical protein